MSSAVVCAAFSEGVAVVVIDISEYSGAELVRSRVSGVVLGFTVGGVAGRECGLAFKSVELPLIDLL